MTIEEILIVKRTWKIFRSINPELVGDTFYSKLFADNPRVRAMFPKNMNQQYVKLMDMLSMVVSRLERMDEITEEVSALARRHVGYGVRPGHYALVGKALLWTLEQGLGTDWTPDVKNAWTKCYNILADTMIKAASGQVSR